MRSTEEVPKEQKRRVLQMFRALLPEVWLFLSLSRGGLETTQGRWLGEVLKAAIERFGRMPRDGWSKCHSIFCDTFGCSTSFNEFRKQ
ncbi:hypothetical protein PAEPH01_2594, partial [Pancytospora epiphaga]